MLFYCFNYFLRVSPGVMQAELSQAFHITATQFGTLAGLYYFAYTPMQLPAGILYDKFGVRFVLSVACLVAALGLGIFIYAKDYYFAGLGRLVIGLGCAFAYIGTLKLASIWLPAGRFATAAGLATAIGMTAGALAQKYLTHAVELAGYQHALQSTLFMGLLLSVFIALVARDRPASPQRTTGSSSTTMTSAPLNQQQPPMDFASMFHALRQISVKPQMWLIGCIGCLLYLPSSVFLDLWGISYLKTAHHLTALQAADIANYTFYGWIFGGPVIGAFSDRLGQRRLPLVMTGGAAGLLLCLVFYLPNLSLSSLSVLFFSIGFCCGAHPLCFALGKESNPIQLAGTAIALTNMLIMAGGMVFQPVVGKLLDYHTTSPLGPDGLPVYLANDFTFALSVVPFGVVLGLILSLFLKETHCMSIEEGEAFAVERRKAPMTMTATGGQETGPMGPKKGP